MKSPRTAQEVHSALAAAYNTGNIDAVLKIYDTRGIIVAQPGQPVSGKEKFTNAVKDILAVKGTMEIKTVYCLQTGDVAVGRSEWSIKEGDNVKVSAKGIELMRQQSDGTWKVVVDHAFGANANLAAE
jgi:uncharacterized protein (TIGR02246 family)